MPEHAPTSPRSRRGRRARQAADSSRPEQDETPLSLGYIDSLQYCLDLRGAPIRKLTIMGLSGETFRTFYDPSVPGRGPYVVAYNPLRAACSALGYDCEVVFQRTIEVALGALDQALAEQGAVIVHSAREWVVLLPGNGTGQQFRVRFPRGVEETWSREELSRQWLQEAGLLELGLPGYYHFSVGEKTRDPNRKDAALGAIRRGIRMLTRKTRVEGCVPGVAAYEELAVTLTRKRKDDAQKALDLTRYASWNAFPLIYTRATRLAAADYLESIREVFDEPEAREHLDLAAAKYRQAAEMLTSLPPLPEHIPHVAVTTRGPSVSLTPQARQAVKAYMRLRRSAARQMRRLHKIEIEAVDELSKVIDTVEREKQQ
jgi:hypothetical protein